MIFPLAKEKIGSPTEGGPDALEAKIEISVI
jgi:hypothetical protein